MDSSRGSSISRVRRLSPEAAAALRTKAPPKALYLDAAVKEVAKLRSHATEVVQSNQLPQTVADAQLPPAPAEYVPPYGAIVPRSQKLRRSEITVEPPEHAFTVEEKAAARKAYAAYVDWVVDAVDSGAPLSKGMKANIVAELLERAASALHAQGVKVLIDLVPGTTEGSVIIRPEGTHLANVRAASFALHNPRVGGERFEMGIWPSSLLEDPSLEAAWYSTLGLLQLPIDFPLAPSDPNVSVQHELRHAHATANLLKGVERPFQTEAFSTERMSNAYLPHMYDDYLGFTELEAYAQDVTTELLDLESKLQRRRHVEEAREGVEIDATYGVAVATRALASARRALAALDNPRAVSYDVRDGVLNARIQLPQKLGKKAHVVVPLVGHKRREGRYALRKATERQLQWEIVAATSTLTKFRLAQAVLAKMGRLRPVEDGPLSQVMLEALRPVLGDRSFFESPRHPAVTYREGVARYNQALEQVWDRERNE